MSSFAGPPLLNSRPEYTPTCWRGFRTNQSASWKDLGRTEGLPLRCMIPYDTNWGRSTVFNYSRPLDDEKAPRIPFAYARPSQFQPIRNEPWAYGTQPFEYK